MQTVRPRGERLRKKVVFLFNLNESALAVYGIPFWRFLISTSVGLRPTSGGAMIIRFWRFARHLLCTLEFGINTVENMVSRIWL
jgi:hypothetical protein